MIGAPRRCQRPSQALLSLRGATRMRACSSAAAAYARPHARRALAAPDGRRAMRALSIATAPTQWVRGGGVGRSEGQARPRRAQGAKTGRKGQRRRRLRRICCVDRFSCLIRGSER